LSAASLPFTVTPYKVSYVLELQDSQSFDLVEQADGVMDVEMHELVNGWTLTQKGELRIVMPQEEDLDDPCDAVQKVQWVYTFWEAKNGRYFRFILRRWVDGFLEQDLQGHVDYDPQTLQGKVTYESPANSVQPIHGELLFPLAHQSKILDKMKEGAPGIVSSLVFNGTSVEGPLRLNSFVGDPHALTLPQKGSAPSKRQKNAHPSEPLTVWPIFTASHHRLSIQEKGDSEVAHTLTADGVPVTLVLDMGDFKVIGTRLPERPQHSAEKEAKKATKKRAEKKETLEGHLLKEKQRPTGRLMP
jgi:hypothetical protein